MSPTGIPKVCQCSGKILNPFGRISILLQIRHSFVMLCFMLYRGGVVLTGSSYGGGRGPIWMDDLECLGNETSIQSCTRKPWGVNNCGHDEDVAVSCTPGRRRLYCIACWRKLHFIYVKICIASVDLYTKLDQF